MDFFNLLREHARTRTETMAVASPRRSMTYRKLWSRIERASARLQQEWKIGKNDIVIYYGDSHPDALVLYFALARSGARLLPLSSRLPGSEVASIAGEFRPSLLLHDDELSLSAAISFVPVKFLSSLIATRCPQEPGHVVEDARHPALLWCSNMRGIPPRAYSLAQLWVQSEQALPVSEAKVDSLLEPAVMTRTVLPVLQSGGCLVLA